DWKDAAEKTLALVGKGKFVILQNYLGSDTDLAKRRYLLASYLLVKGAQTYLSYHASSTLTWFPEWDLNLGRPLQHAGRIDDLLWRGVYRRDFANGIVLVNPTTSTVRVDLDVLLRRVEPHGGGPVPRTGTARGTIETTRVTRVVLQPKSAEILLR